MKADFAGFPEGKDLCEDAPTGSLSLVASGAYAQCSSSAVIQLIMIGPISDTKLLLQGYGVIEEKGGKLRQEEKFAFTKHSTEKDQITSTWIGSYTLSQITSGQLGADMPAGTLKATFEATAVLQIVPESGVAPAPSAPTAPAAPQQSRAQVAARARQAATAAAVAAALPSNAIGVD